MTGVRARVKVYAFAGCCSLHVVLTDSVVEWIGWLNEVLSHEVLDSVPGASTSKQGFSSR